MQKLFQPKAMTSRLKQYSTRNWQGAESANDAAAVHCGMMMPQPTDRFGQLPFGNKNRAEPVEIWKARNFIREHLDDEISLTTVGKLVNVNANYLSEKFKKVTGINFVDYIARARIEKARKLLEDVDLRISEIAFAVGFQSLSQFNRVFKKLCGKSPSAYRALPVKKHTRRRNTA